MNSTKRKVVVIALVVVFLLKCSMVVAAPADPKGAYGLFWGESVQVVKEKASKEKWKARKDIDNFKGVVNIMSPRESRLEYSAKIEGYSTDILLMFFDNSLYRIMIDYAGRDRDRDSRLEKIFNARYGKQIEGANSGIWEIGDSRITLIEIEPRTEGNFVTVFDCVQLNNLKEISKIQMDFIRENRKQ